MAQGGTDGPRTSWILGAGFSRSLGGPLLADLFSWRTKQRIDVCFGEWQELADRDDIYSAYHSNLGPDASHGGLWDDAEAFLERLERAAASAEEAKILHIIHAMPWSEKLPGAKRLLAAECSVFHRHVPVEGERGAAYTKWGSHLTSNDVLLTFNYDTVPEKYVKRVCPLSIFTAEWHKTKTVSASGNQPLLLKLHGSVNWKRNAGTRQKTELDVPSWDTDMMLCPGDGKASAYDTDFAALWSYAGEQIQESQAIVFMGYRFPPSDGAARALICDAIGNNQSPNLDLFLVLGPNNPDAKRVKDLLSWACISAGRVPWGLSVASGKHKGFRVHETSLYVEDLLTTYRPGALARWAEHGVSI